MKPTYREVLEANCERILAFYDSDYHKELQKENIFDYVKKVVTEALYVDPDNYIPSKNDRTGCILSADGIISAKKLYDLFDGKSGKRWIEEYRVIRSEERVCLFWPRHRGGINSCKANVFNDRVDYTLFDIKRFYEILERYKVCGEQEIKKEVKEQCKLGNAFIKLETYNWLCELETFSKFIESCRLEKFVDSEFQVIDLETNEPITDYKKKYAYDKKYYGNLKRLMLIGSMVTVKVDRPMGSYHPKHTDLFYPINYGYVEGVIAPDGDEQDAYLLGVDEPVDEFTGRIIAIVHRYDDVEEKWVVAPENINLSLEEIKEQIGFQEQYFDSEIRMQGDSNGYFQYKFTRCSLHE